MNTLDYILIAALIVAVGFALRRIRLDKKQGKGCGGNCAGCTMPCEDRKEEAK